MKKLLVLVLSIVMIASISLVSFAEATEVTLIPSGETWTSIDAGGEVAKMNFEGSVATLNGSSASWPCVYADYTSPITVAADATVNFDLSFTAGKTSIILFFNDTGVIAGAESDIAVINSKITDNLEAGTNDILPGTYSGSFKFNELTLPTSYANEDGSYTITGIKIFTVVGAEVTFNKLSVTAEVAAEESVVEESETETPQTGDVMPVVAAIAAVVSLAGALVIKKVR